MKYGTLRIVCCTLLVACAFHAATAAVTEKEPASQSLPQAGVGLALRIKDGKVLVETVLPDSPAARSNSIKRGDQVIAISEGDNKPTELTDIKELAKVVGMIRGSIGSVVRLSIIPVGKGE